MKTTQKGFTLIELMIVIAIIAILAAIAIPQYEKYITKSQFSEAPSIAAGVETDVQLYWTQSGDCPTLGQDGFKDGGSYSGKYIQSISLADSAAGAGGTCDLKMTFKGQGSVSEPLQGNTVTFAGTQNGGNFNWECSSTTIAAEYLPQACR